MAVTPSILTSAPPPLRTVALRVTDLTPESFAPYGQVIDTQRDGVPFGPHDAQLDLSRGIPRFYLMRLRGGNLRFTKITHHANTTQCLGAINGMPWYLGVTPPTIVENCEKVGSEQALKGDGYVYLPPDVEDVRVFRVDGPRFLKLHRGTWHAGPLFEEPWMDFYNLELSRTNEDDNPTYNFQKKKGIMCEVEKPS